MKVWVVKINVVCRDGRNKNNFSLPSSSLGLTLQSFQTVVERPVCLAD